MRDYSSLADHVLCVITLDGRSLRIHSTNAISYSIPRSFVFRLLNCKRLTIDYQQISFQARLIFNKASSDFIPFAVSLPIVLFLALLSHL